MVSGEYCGSGLKVRRKDEVESGVFVAEAFGQILIGEVAFVGVDTVPESGVIVEQGFDATVIAGFDQ